MGRQMFRTVQIAAAGLFGLSLAACSSNAPGSTEAADAPAPVVVYAAASLQESFTQLIDEYVAEHADAEFAPLETAGSQQLVQQINEGASVDVLALANESSLEPLQSPAADADFAIFAENTLVVVTAKDNPANITSLDDLTNPDAKVVICEQSVPCGSATKTLFENQGIEVSAVSEENNVKAVLNKIELGEADAGLVYISDATTSDGVDWFEPEGADEVVNRYPIAALSDNPHATGFVEFVRSDRGREVLEAAGLVVPGE